MSVADRAAFPQGGGLIALSAVRLSPLATIQRVKGSAAEFRGRYSAGAIGKVIAEVVLSLFIPALGTANRLTFQRLLVISFSFAARLRREFTAVKRRSF
jgi:hypothetical protein